MASEEVEANKAVLHSAMTTFFSPAASRIKAALVKAGFLIEPLPD